MRFQVGSFMYKLVLADGPLIHEGEAVMVVVDKEKRLIQMSRECPPASRLNLLLEWMVYAWSLHVPAPNNTGDRARLWAVIGAGVVRDLQRQGGESALMLLDSKQRGGFDPAIFTHTLSPNGGGRACFKCESPWACGSVHHGEPVRDDKLAKHVVEMLLHCESCGDLQLWTELASGSGQPTGEAVGEVRRLGWESVKRWAQQRPQHQTRLTFVS